MTHISTFIIIMTDFKSNKYCVTEYFCNKLYTTITEMIYVMIYSVESRLHFDILKLCLCDRNAWGIKRGNSFNSIWFEEKSSKFVKKVIKNFSFWSHKIQYLFQIHLMIKKDKKNLNSCNSTFLLYYIFLYSSNQ